MASRGRGAKQKGSAFERKIAKKIRESGLDPDAGRMPLSGASSHLKGDVRTCLPYTIEAKCQERVQFWAWWEQAKEQAHYHPPVLCISANHRPILAVVELDTLLNLMLCEQQLNDQAVSFNSGGANERNLCGKDSSTDRRQSRGKSKWKKKVDGTVVERDQ